ncbi:MAG: DUF4115 domain-containing protein [Lactobacillus sp.]|nr:DUF4115 domain-containing protein [Lactobacillus sp.]
MADIGQKLQEAREAKGLTIDDVEQATKIQRRYLIAIEQNDFDNLPGDFYVRAFIRQYAQVVGLDGKELLSSFHQDVPETKPDEYVENSIDNKTEEVRETTSTKRVLWREYLPRIIIGVVAIIVVLILYTFLTKALGSNNNNANDDVKVSSSSSTKKVAKPKAKSVSIKDLGNNQYRVLHLKNNRNLLITTSTGASYVQVSVDGTISYQGTLQANSSHNLTIPAGAKTVTVYLGYSECTKVKIAGKKVPYTGSSSTLTLTLLLGNQAATTQSSQTNTQSSTQTNTQSSTQQSSKTSTQKKQSTTTTNNQQSSTTTNKNQTNNNTNNTNNQQKNNKNNNNNTDNKNDGNKNNG